MDFEAFLRLMEALRRQGVEYVLVGGVALSLHGLVRATEDVDLFLRPTEDNVARLREALRSLWQDAAIEQITAADLTGRYPTVRYGPPSGDLVIDILASLGDAFRFEDLEFEIVEVEGIPIRVATPGTLYRMKKDTVRPLDKADAWALREKFVLEED
jgi:hypothetical protein